MEGGSPMSEINPTELFLKKKIESTSTFNCFDHKRQYPINEMCDWLNEYAERRIRSVLLGLKFKMEDSDPEEYFNIVLDQLKNSPVREIRTFDETDINALASIYEKSTHDAAVVATICDEVIDRSGALLGEVRKVVRGEKLCTSCKWRQSKYEYKCEMCVRYSEFKRDTD